MRVAAGLGLAVTEILEQGVVAALDPTTLRLVAAVLLITILGELLPFISGSQVYLSYAVLAFAAGFIGVLLTIRPTGRLS